ncbi:unnamed protein product [Discula destructiva]
MMSVSGDKYLRPLTTKFEDVYATPHRGDSEDEDDSASDTDEENSKETQVERHLKIAVENIVARVSENHKPVWDFTTDQGRDKFLNDNRGILDKVSKTKGNILHMIVEDGKDKTGYEHIMHALSTIVGCFPHLLDQELNTRHAPIFQAVQSNKPYMVSAMVEGFEKAFKASRNGKDEAARRVLGRLVEGETCLHLAIKNSLKETAIQALVAIATEDLLSIQDRQGRTPLHLAVNYQDCGIFQRIDTIREIVRKSNNALILQDNSGHSAFLHHLATREKYEDELSKQNKEGVAPKILEDTPTSRRLEVKLGHERLRNRPIKPDEVEPPMPPSDGNPEIIEKYAQPRFAKADLKTKDYSVGVRDMESPEVLAVRPNQSTRRDDLPASGIYRQRTSQINEGGCENVFRGSSPAHHKVVGLRSSEALTEGQEDTTAKNQTRSTLHAVADHNIAELEWRKEKARRRAREAKTKAELDAAKAELKETVERDGAELEEYEALRHSKESREQRRKIREAARTDPHVLRECSETIQLELKLNCMRKRTPEETSKILYGRNPEDTQICLDCSSHRSSVMMRTFMKSFEQVRLDPVLQYVAFPSITIEKGGANESRISSESHGAGRRDIIEMFDWLRDEKKVTRIIKVIVDDSQYPAHSDDAIVKALSGFQVEELHWLKTDLDPVTIREVSSEIRELYLRWSGNNAVLRGWGEQEGLMLLKNLECVYIDVVAELNLESSKQTKKNFDAFKKRLSPKYALPRSMAGEKAFSSSADTGEPESRSIKVVSRNFYSRNFDSADRRGDGSGKEGESARSDYDGHKWLDSMDAFAQEMSRLWKYAAHPATGPTRSHDLGKPVVVALIDDGVDIVDPSFLDRSYGGQSLSSDIVSENEPRTHQRVHPYHYSERGNGTVMASLIYRVCPMAKLYIIRLPTVRDANGKRVFAARSAAAGVRAAIDKGVNIISMSWSVTADANNTNEDIGALQNAILAAEREKILMFCSSSDGGQFLSDTYPSHTNEDRVFCIGAANADGSPYSWAGPLEKLHYILPGVDVVKQLPGRRSSRLLKEKMVATQSETGSSVATALAAGLAAMIITLAKMAAIHTADSLNDRDVGVNESMVEQLQVHANMKYALDYLDPTPNKFMQVWKRLDTKTWGNYNDHASADKLRIVAMRVLTTFFGPGITYA